MWKYGLVFQIYPNFKGFLTKNVTLFWKLKIIFQCIYFYCTNTQDLVEKLLSVAEISRENHKGVILNPPPPPSHWKKVKNSTMCKDNEKLMEF